MLDNIYIYAKALKANINLQGELLMSDKFYTISIQTASIEEVPKESGLFAKLGNFLERKLSNKHGTEDKVQVKLYGSERTTEYIDLPRVDNPEFSQGSNVTFYLGNLNIGDLDSIEFRKNGNDDWGVKSFTVFDGENSYKSNFNGVTTVKDQLKFGVDKTNSSQPGVSKKFENDTNHDVINGVWFHVTDKDGNRDQFGKINTDQNTYFVTHGFQDGIGNQWISSNELNEWQANQAKAIKKFDPDANVVVVDWHEKNFTSLPKYLEAVNSVPRVSADIAEYITKYDLNPEKISLIGHSLGAHVSGIAGQNVKGIDQIIGMDPAGLGYEDRPKDLRLSPDDAENVYGIHTSSLLGLGYQDPLGDYDLYLNSSEYEKSIVPLIPRVSYSHPTPNIENNLPPTQHGYARTVTTKLFEGETIEGESWIGDREVKDLDITKFLDESSYSNGLIDTKNLEHRDQEVKSLFFRETGYVPLDVQVKQKLLSVVERGLSMLGPLDDAYIFFDTNRNFIWDEGEVFTQTDEFGNYEIDLTEQNNYTDGTKGVWNGKEFVPDEEPTVDFRDGLIVAIAPPDSSEDRLKDTITGKDYGVPLFTIPTEEGKNANPSIITTFKYAPVSIWSDTEEAPAWTTEEQFYEKLTPEVAEDLFANNFAGIPEKLLEDDYDPYTEFGEGASDALDSIAYTYQMLALTLTTAELFEKLEIDVDNWGIERDLETYPGLVAMRAINFVMQAKDDQAGPYYKELWDELNYDWDSLDISNSQQIAEAWEYIYNTHATKLGTEDVFFGEDGRPIDRELVLEKVEELPLEFIAEGLGQVQEFIDTILEGAEEKGSHLVIPAIAGPKRFFLTELVENIVDIAFESEDQNEYQNKLNSVLVQPTYVNYDDVDKAIFISTDDQWLDIPILENVIIAPGETTTKSFNIALSEPAPTYGLTVRYQIGGDAIAGEDYERINSDNNLYGSFFIPPGAESYSLDFEINGDAIDGGSDSLQLKLLTADSGYTTLPENQSATFVISKAPVEVEDKITFEPTSEVTGDSGDNELKIDDGAYNPVVTGGEGSDRFFLNPNAEGVTHFSDFNWTEDKIVALPGDFPNATPQDFTVVAGTLFYQNQPLALISNLIDGEEKAYSYALEVPIEIDKSGDDIMRGGENDDSFNSGQGNDKMRGGSGNDTLNSGKGNDRMWGQSGNDYLIGRSGNDILMGGEGSDTLEGGIGRDRLNGGPGNDVLIGGASIDRFIFNTNEEFTSEDLGTDEITDFVPGKDIILLDRDTFTVLTSVKGEGFSVTTEFAEVTTDAEARNSNGFIVYNSENGKLFYNPNGSATGLGGGANFATLTNKAEISADDFFLR
ncbi:PLAT/LH2 domain-containing protein [Okeania sp.]|uniref:PLAT/LH2 domain-containing protein n=1 Tax=Okeania sp. TaxID=3100323 RepID=UPI002B4AD14E|nr:PLAT/LH2 domain-containing protein [Okeania sp.]MEB3340727.1 PLAT/LH2 domain-containing protein [Okeania sp.]